MNFFTSKMRRSPSFIQCDCCRTRRHASQFPKLSNGTRSNNCEFCAQPGETVPAKMRICSPCNKCRVNGPLNGLPQ